MPYKYLILDSRGNAVAHATTEHIPQGSEWYMTVDDGDVDEVTKHTYFSLVGDSDAAPALEGRLLRRKGNVIVLEPVRPLEQSLRKNLRIPVRFSSYIYPRTGKWRGRVPIVSYDLSCGGIAFFCPRPLENGEQVQIVIPVTTQPLLVDMKILCRRSSEQEEPLYAAEFISLLREEEKMIREAVFSLQLQKG